MILEVIFIYTEGGFELGNFVRNSIKVLKNIFKYLVAGDMLINMDANNGQRVLRIIWEATTDKLMFSWDFLKIDAVN